MLGTGATCNERDEGCNQPNKHWTDRKRISDACLANKPSESGVGQWSRQISHRGVYAVTRLSIRSRGCLCSDVIQSRGCLCRRRGVYDVAGVSMQWCYRGRGGVYAAARVSMQWCFRGRIFEYHKMSKNTSNIYGKFPMRYASQDASSKWSRDSSSCNLFTSTKQVH